MEEMVKLTLFANDLNCFLRDKDSYMLFQFILEHFSDLLLLKVNHEHSSK